VSSSRTPKILLIPRGWHKPHSYAKMRHALTFAGYIHMKKDMTTPYDYQKWLVESMRKEGARV
jgi:hypothetical protein